MATKQYDVFLSHHSADKPVVEFLARKLEEAGIRPFLDKWHLIPGEPIQEALEFALDQSATCAVFLGAKGPGPWANEEMRAALAERVRNSAFRVIPVLLPGTHPDDPAALPPFLKRLHWVDFRGGIEDEEAFERLLAGIRGHAPKKLTRENASPEQIRLACPYRGLSAFREEDEALFFGRESWSERLLAMVAQQPFVAILGASGSGKSSLVQAGLLPKLRRQGHWHILCLRPLSDAWYELSSVVAPLLEPDSDEIERIKQIEHLATEFTAGTVTLSSVFKRLARKDAEARWLLLIDQFEELYAPENTSIRAAFIKNVLQVLTDTSIPFSIVITLRSDFLGQTHSQPELSHAIADNHIIVPAMDREELRRAIAEPASRAGFPLHDEVVDLLLEQSAGREGALPLLEFALTRIWEGLAHGVEPAETLQQIGGVGGALANKAQELFKSLDKTEPQIARRAFLAMIRPGEPRNTRRRVNIADIVGYKDDPEQVHNVLRVFAQPGVRLITMADDTAEITHEALFEHWETLKIWLKESEQDRPFEERLTQATKHWDDYQRPADLLWRSVLDLDQLRAYHQRHEQDMTALQMEFFQQSVRKEKQTRFRKRATAAVLVLLTVISVIGAMWAVQSEKKARESERIAQEERNKAKESEQISRSRELAAHAWLSLRDNKPDLAIALALEANKIFPTDQAQNALADVAYYTPGTRRCFLGHTDRVTSVAFSQDGTIALSGSADGSLRLWNLSTGEEIHRLTGHTDRVTGVAFSPDGRTVLSGASDFTLRLWNIETGQELRSFIGHTDAVNSIAFSPDGNTVLSGSRDRTVRLWDINRSQEIYRFEEHSSEVSSVAFSPDSHTAVSGSLNEELCWWDIDKRNNIYCESLAKYPYGGYGIHNLAFRPDGHSVLVSFEGFSGTPNEGNVNMLLWNLQEQKIVTLFNADVKNTSVAFSPDGCFAVSGGDDKSLRIWNVQTGDEIQVLQGGHTNTITDVAFSPEGNFVLSGSADHSVRLWDMRSGGEIFRFAGVGKIFASDNKSIFGVAPDNHLQISQWDIKTGQELKRFAGHEWIVGSITLSPNGKTLLSGSQDRSLRLWDIKTGKEIRSFTGHTHTVASVAFSPDGKRAVSGSNDQSVRLWDIETGEEIQRFTGHTKPVRSVAFSPDSRYILSGSEDYSLRVWNINTGEEFRIFTGHTGIVFSVTFHPKDSSLALSGADDNRLCLWDITTGERIRCFVGHSDAVRSAVFSPDGSTILSSSKDRSVRLWDVNTGEEIQRFTGHTNLVGDVAFSPDGQVVLSNSWDGTTRLWRVTPPQDFVVWTKKNRYVRELTCDERRQYRVTPYCSEEE